jgi:hypothetical protein
MGIREKFRMPDSKFVIQRYAWIFALVIFGSSVFAQDFKRQYKQAKDLFEEKKYNLAMEAFKPLIVYDQNNPYSEYASYFYALSSYEQGYQSIAKDMLIQIKKLYPNWKQLDEVNFWLARIYFEQHEYFQGLLILKSIRSAHFKEDVAAMQSKYISQIDDPETLKMVLEEYPDNTVAAYALAKSLSKQPLYQQDVRLLDSLINAFHFNRNEFISNTKPLSVKKDKYRVSLLFPFLAKSLEASPGTKANQFVLDLYEGMRLAVDTLARQGIRIDLLAYDTERNTEVLKKLLQTDELKSTDLIVGPLFSEEAKLVQEFSMANQINMINPVSNNSGFLGQNPFALLYQPSFETMGVKSAELVFKKVRNKNCIVFFGDTPKDSVMAFSFMKKAKELGINIVLAEEVNRETSVHIQPLLATPTELDEYKNPIDFTMKRDSIGSIYVASDNPIIYSKVISGVQSRSDSTLIIGSENWSSPDNTSTNYETFERLRITMASPNYVYPGNPNYIAFRKRFVSRHGQLPSLYARIGFEFILFVGKALSQYGVFFQEGLNQIEYTPGLFGEGYNFQGSRDNQYVPFVRFQEGALMPVK